MTYDEYILNSKELYHHGILGMKWGVRRTPEQLGHKLKKYTSPVREIVKSQAKHYSILALSTFVPGLSLAYMTKTTVDTLSHGRNMLDGEDYTKKEGPPEKLSRLKKKTVKYSALEDMKACNPRSLDKKGTVNNCGYCAVAMEMRRRGYDVRARRKAQGITLYEYSKWFDDVEIRNPGIQRNPKESRKSFVQRSYENLCREIEKCGDGSHGCVSIQYEDLGGGHAMFWEVTNGRVNFYDGQNNKLNPDKTFSLADPNLHSFIRLDNLKLKPEITETVISVNKEDEN